MSVSVTLSGSIKASDSVSGTISLSKVLTSLITPGTTFSEAQSLSIPAALTGITLPISPATFLYIKNLHATQTLTVTWTPNGGASNVVVTLQPGSFIAFGEAVLGLSGITALSVQGSGAATLIEYVLGG